MFPKKISQEEEVPFQKHPLHRPKYIFLICIEVYEKNNKYLEVNSNDKETMTVGKYNNNLIISRRASQTLIYFLNASSHHLFNLISLLLVPDLPLENECNWSEFGDWSKCSAICGVGIENRRRTLNLALRGLGSDCSQQPPSETRTCHIVACGSE